MDIRQLRSLLAIVETGSFARAAEKVGITASAVSQQIQALEIEVGASLFNRETRPPILTAAGAQMVEAATELIRTTENVIDAISGRRITGTFAIGSVRTSAIGLLPRAISRLISNHSGLKIRLRVGLSETLMQDVASGHLDTAMIAENGVSSPDVVWTPFIREPLCLVAPLGTPPAPLQQMLATHPYVRFKANVPLAKVIDRELSRMNPVLNEIAEMDNVAAVIACVANGLGISIVPQVATQNVSPQLVTIPFGDTPVYRQIGLLRRHTSPRHQLIDELHEHLAAVSGEYGVGLDTTGRSKA